MAKTKNQQIIDLKSEREEAWGQVHELTRTKRAAELDRNSAIEECGRLRLRIEQLEKGSINLNLEIQNALAVVPPGIQSRVDSAEYHARRLEILIERLLLNKIEDQ